MIRRWLNGRAIDRDLDRLEAKAAAFDFKNATPDEMLAWAATHREETLIVHRASCFNRRCTTEATYSPPAAAGETRDFK